MAPPLNKAQLAYGQVKIINQTWPHNDSEETVFAIQNPTSLPQMRGTFKNTKVICCSVRENVKIVGHKSL